MTPPTRRILLAGLVLGLLAVAAARNGLWMADRRQAARRATEDLAACEHLAARIEALRARPAVASAEAMGVQEFGQRFAAASKAVGLTLEEVPNVIPQTARRVGNSPYLVKPTDMMLRGVTLEQVVTFLGRLTADSGLTVSELHLRAPHGEAVSPIWDADVTVTYLMYAPIEPDGA